MAVESETKDIEYWKQQQQSWIAHRNQQESEYDKIIQAIEDQESQEIIKAVKRVRNHYKEMKAKARKEFNRRLAQNNEALGQIQANIKRLKEMTMNDNIHNNNIETNTMNKSTAFDPTPKVTNICNTRPHPPNSELSQSTSTLQNIPTPTGPFTSISKSQTVTAKVFDLNTSMDIDTDTNNVDLTTSNLNTIESKGVVISIPNMPPLIPPQTHPCTLSPQIQNEIPILSMKNEINIGELSPKKEQSETISVTDNATDRTNSNYKHRHSLSQPIPPSKPQQIPYDKNQKSMSDDEEVQYQKMAQIDDETDSESDSYSDSDRIQTRSQTKRKLIKPKWTRRRSSLSQQTRPTTRGHPSVRNRKRPRGQSDSDPDDEDYIPFERGTKRRKYNNMKKSKKNTNTNTNIKPKKNSKAKSKPGEEYKHLKLDEAVKDFKLSPDRQTAWNNRMKSPNEFYYRFNANGISRDQKNQQRLCLQQPCKTGAFGSTSTEHKLFMQRVKALGVNTEWGIFSKTIPGRVGYKCSSYWRKLITRGDIEDPNYVKIKEDDGKTKLIWKWKPIFRKSKKVRKQCDIEDLLQFTRYGFTVVNDRSNVWENGETHPKHPGVTNLKDIETNYEAFYCTKYKKYLQQKRK